MKQIDENLMKKLMKKIYTPVYCLLYDETEKEVQDLKKRKKKCEKPKNIVKMNKT